MRAAVRLIAATVAAREVKMMAISGSISARLQLSETGETAEGCEVFLSWMTLQNGFISNRSIRYSLTLRKKVMGKA